MERSISKHIHISIDDVNIILKELTEGSYNSIYEHRIFKFFKTLKDTYGAVFSLYCFYQNPVTPEWTLKDMTNKFKHEFKDAASWLKFGFHGESTNLRYDKSIEPDQALKHYKDFINSIENFADATSIDDIPRIHYFAGTVEQCRKWRDTNNGIRGFLAADDTREVNGYLNLEERNLLEEHSVYFEEKEGLYFVKTNLRLEKVSDPYKVLEASKENQIYSDEQSIKIIFTHECYLSDEVMLSKIKDCCKWAKDNEFTFAYPMEFLL